MSVAMPFIAGAGLVTQVYGQLKSASDQANAAEQNAKIKESQAIELLSRQAINESIIRSREASEELSIGLGSRGLGNTGIGAILTSRQNMIENLALSQREAEWKAKQLRMGAEVDKTLASDISASGTLGAVGTILTGATTVYDAYNKYSRPTGTTGYTTGLSGSN